MRADAGGFKLPTGRPLAVCRGSSASGRCKQSCAMQGTARVILLLLLALMCPLIAGQSRTSTATASGTGSATSTGTSTWSITSSSSASSTATHTQPLASATSSGTHSNAGTATAGPASSSSTATATATSSIAASATVTAALSGQQCICTLAGTGAAGSGGIGGPASSAVLNDVIGVTLDGIGGYYIADWATNIVYRVNASGILTRFAGTGVAGPIGNGLAINAQLQSPACVALDATGGVLIADELNYAVRRVNASGYISTYAGTGIVAYAGDGGPVTAAAVAFGRVNSVSVNGSDVYICDRTNSVIRQVHAGNISTVAGSGSGLDGGAATSASLNTPFSVAFDASFGSAFLLADQGNNRIRRVGGNISTVAGTGTSGFSGDRGPATSARLNGPRGVTADGLGGYYIADQNNHAIRWVNASGFIFTVAGAPPTSGYSGDGGPPTAAKLGLPNQVAIDGFGGFLIAEEGSHVVRYVTPAGMCQPLLAPSGCTVLPGNATVRCDFAQVAPYVQLAVTLAGVACSVNATPPATNRSALCPVPATQVATLFWMTNVANASINVAITQASPPPSPTVTTSLTATVTAAASLVATATAFVGVSSTSSTITSSATPGPSLNLNGSVAVTASQAAASPSPNATSTPTWIASMITTTSASQVAATTASVSVSSTSSTITSSTTPTPSLNLSASATSTQAAACITTLAGTGGTQGYNAGPVAASASLLYRPTGVALDAAGGILIADGYNHVIRYLSANGTVSVVAGTGGCAFSADGLAATASSLCYPTGVSSYPTGGCLIADESNHAVRSVDVNGTMRKVAGAGPPATPGFSGDGGPATAATLRSPHAVAQNGNSGFYIAVRNNNAIRYVDNTGFIYTVSGSSLGSFGNSGDGGQAVFALLHYPISVILDGAGGYIFSDQLNSRVRHVVPSGIITTVATATAPYGIALDGAGGMWVADSSDSVIRWVNLNGAVATGVIVAGTRLNSSFSGDGGAATSATLSTPSLMVTDGFGGIIFAEEFNHVVRYVTPPAMCVPALAPTGCSVMLDNATVRCDLVLVAPYLQLAVQLGGTSCKVTAASPPAVNRSAWCTAPGTQTTSLTVQTQIGKISYSVVIVPLSPSAAATAGPTPSPTASSASVTGSPTPNTLVTTSVPPTATSSPVASGNGMMLTLQVVAAVSSSSSSSPSLSLPAIQVLRDIDAPVVLRAAAIGCAGNSSCWLVCSADSSFVRSAVSPATLDPTASALVYVWAPFRSLAVTSSSVLTCVVARVDGSAAAAQITFIVQPSALPLLTDVLVHLAAYDQDVLLQSVWTSTVCNVSASWAQASAAAGAAIDTSDVLYSSLSSMLPGSAAYDAAVGTCASRGSAPAATFTATATGSSNVTLVARSGFTSQTRVVIGGVPARNLRASADGSLLHIQLPDTRAICNSYDCGVVALTILASDGNVTCPGLCTDFAGQVPQCNGTCIAASVGNDLSTPVPLAAAQIQPGGFRITSACNDPKYLSPSTGICANASDPRHAQCAFGASDACTSCPANAICPGGFRAWPLPGYYTAAETAATVTQCPPPSSRCAGWNAALSTVVCSTGYRNGSYLCAACAVGYYATDDGSCGACPATPSLVESIKPFAIFLGYVAAALVVMYAFMLGVAALVKSRTDDIHNRITTLAAWSFTSVQLVAQAGRASPAGLPPLLASLYSGLAVSQFAAISLPASCVIGYAYSSEVASCSAGLLMLLVVSVLSSTCRRGASFTHAHANTLWMAVLGLTLIYPILVNSTLSLVVCTRVRMPIVAYLALDGGDGTSLTRAGITSVTSVAPTTLIDVFVQASNPSRVCYEGSHTTASILAWVTLVLVGCVYPLAAMLIVSYRVRADLAADAHARDACDRITSNLNRTGRNTMSRTAAIGGTHDGTTHTAKRSSSSMSGRSAASDRGARASAKEIAPTVNPARTPALAMPTGQPDDVELKTDPSCPSSRCQHCCPDAAVDTSTRVLADALINIFVHSDYRPAAYSFYAVDRYVLLALSAATAALRSTTDTTTVIARAAVMITVLIINGVLVLALSPFDPSEWWKRAIKLLTIVLTCMMAALNAMASVMTLQASQQGTDLSAGSSTAIAALSYVVFALCACLLLALPITFMLNAIHPPPRVIARTEAEAVQVEQAAVKAAQQAAALDHSIANPLARGSIRSRMTVVLAEAPLSSARVSAPPSSLAATLAFASSRGSMGAQRQADEAKDAAARSDNETAADGDAAALVSSSSIANESEPAELAGGELEDAQDADDDPVAARRRQTRMHLKDEDVALTASRSSHIGTTSRAALLVRRGSR